MSSTETTTSLTTLQFMTASNGADFTQEINEVTSNMSIIAPTSNMSLQNYYNRSSFDDEAMAAATTEIIDLVHDEPEHNDIANISVLCFKSFIFGSIIIGAVLGNALVILAVRRNRKLR